MSVTPSSGTGSAQTFAFVFTDPGGESKIVWTQIDISAALVVGAACYIDYSPSANEVFLYNDAGTSWGSGLTVGVAGTLENSQCSINAGASSFSVSGDNLTLNLAVSFTATGTGKGQGAIIQNSGSPVAATPNSASNPTPVGSIVAIYATGGGLLSPAVEDGSVTLLGGLTAPMAPVSLTIGGQPAQIQYAAPPPYEVSGMLQINAVVPTGIGSGAQPVVLTIGSNNNASQQVTVAVK